MARNAAILEALDRFILRPAQWDERAAAWSKTIPYDNPDLHLPGLFKRCVEGGESNLCHICDQETGEAVGFVLWWPDGDELVIQAAAGRHGTGLTAEIVEMIQPLAREQGCNSIRFHTMRPALIQKTKALGFHISEVIMRKDVPNG